jgi:hypothetical protein
MRAHIVAITGSTGTKESKDLAKKTEESENII